MQEAGQCALAQPEGLQHLGPVVQRVKLRPRPHISILTVVGTRQEAEAAVSR